MYRPNNIEFRIASAAAIGRFKAAQANALTQVCRKEFDFDVSAKEAVLLEYDRFSSWIFSIERAFLDEELQRPSTALMNFTAFSLNKLLKEIEQTCVQYPTVFSKETVKFLVNLHQSALNVFHQELDVKFKGHSAKEFTRIVELATLYLEHILISMHEFNNNIVLKKSPFICISSFCRLSADFSSLNRRAKYFISQGVDGIFVLKNYTDETATDEAIAALSGIGIHALSEIEFATA